VPWIARPVACLRDCLSRPDHLLFELLNRGQHAVDGAQTTSYDAFERAVDGSETGDKNRTARAQLSCTLTGVSTAVSNRTIASARVWSLISPEL